MKGTCYGCWVISEYMDIKFNKTRACKASIYEAYEYEILPYRPINFK